MRLLSLRLERYGAFTDRTLAFREGALLHVVLGPNEAGKTSALCAIGDLLFGFSHETRSAFRHKQSQLRIGASLRLDDGSILEVRRRKGRANTLLDQNDGPLAHDPLTPLLGGVARKTFDLEFGLTGEKLREGGEELLRSGGRLAETLAAASTRLQALSQLRAALAAEADEIFSARRVRSKPFYVAYDRYQDAEKELRDRVVTLDALRSAETAVKDAQDRRDALTSAQDQNGLELARRERALRTRAKLQRIALLRSDLADHAALPHVEANASTRWRTALQELGRVEEALKEQQTEQAAEQEAIAGLEVDERLLELGEKIGALREAVGAVREAEKDLPSRRAEAREAQDNLDSSARRLGVDDHEALAARQPTDAALARVEELIDKLGKADLKRAEAADALEAARNDALAASEAVRAGGEAVDPARLRQSFELFEEVASKADRLRRDSLAHAAGTRRLEERLSQLEPIPPALAELARAPLPDAAKIEAARQKFEALDAEDKRAAVESDGLQNALAEAEREIVALQREGDVATREDLATARQARDEAFDRLSEALDDGPPRERRRAFDALGAEGRKIDATTDLLLTGAERAARYAAACEKRARVQRDYERMRAAQDERLARWRALSADWRAVWTGVGVEPSAPREMAAWRERVSEMLQERERLDGGRLEIDALAQELEAMKPSLLRLVAEMGEEADPALPIEAAHKLARATLERLQRRWTDARTAVTLREKALATLARAEQNQSKAQEAFERTAADWPSAAGAIGLDGAATPAQAKAALAVWRGIPLYQERLRTAKHRIEGMEQNIAAFDASVAALVKTAAPELDDLNSRAALNVLSERLGRAQAENKRRETLLEATRKREAFCARFARRRDELEAMLAAARAVFGLASEAPLDAALERAERRNAQAAELDACLRDLADVADERDEATLRAEQADLDFDLVPGAIERLKIDRKEILGDIEVAATALHDARRRRDELMQGRNAASAAAQRAEAGAELVSVAMRWSLRASAARLAARAIERHRAVVEDPLISRASALFAAATDGAFAGLGADYDEDDRPALKGVRASGEKVAVPEMSEGTRDQLYLSLRLALLELRGGEALPFIGDDLLASFDDLRTARALELIAEFGRARQAIVFTHHRRVAEIAAGSAGLRADVVEL